MVNKIGLSLSILILLSTSAVFGMEPDDGRNDRKERMRRKLQEKKNAIPQKQIQYTPEQEDKFNTILSLYEEQAEHHTYMKETIEEYKKDPLSNFWNIFGIPIERGLTTDGSGIPVEGVIGNIIDMHASHVKMYENLAANRRDVFTNKERSLFSQLAGIYYGAIAVSNDAADHIVHLKRKFTPEDANNYYAVKLWEDKIAFYKRVQETLLKEFEANKEELFSELLEQSRCGLDMDYDTSKKLQMSLTTKRFCQDIVNKTYKFPSLESFSDLVLPTEEEEKFSDIIATPKKKKESKNKQPQKTLTPVNLITPTSSDSETDRQIVDPIPSLQVKEEKVAFVPPLPSEEEKKPLGDHAKIVETRRLEVAYAQLESGELKLAEHNYTQALESADDSSSKLEALYEKDREKKKKLPQKIALSLVPEINEVNLGINGKKLLLLSEIFSHPINLNLRWDHIVSLFNGPSGFKGRVYGTKNGSAHTFEVYLKFQKGKFAGFLFEKEFQILKKNAQVELLKGRNFLPNNKRLQSYKVSPEESVATSFFTLHNPHPNPCAYEALVKRLQEQLHLLGITPETVKGLNF